MSLKLNTASGGSITLQEADTASNLTITVPAVSGTMAIQGAAFSAYLGSNQSTTSSTWVKVVIDTEEFDTNSNFNTSNYRFTPTVAGYYQINGNSETTGSVGQVVSIYKNGSEFKRGANITAGNYTTGSVVSALIYMNGSTDYLEMYALTTSNATLAGSGASYRNYFQGCLVRAA
jgi:hypothetical protein